MWLEFLLATYVLFWYCYLPLYTQISRHQMWVRCLFKYLVFCPEWAAAVRLLHFLNIQNFLMWRMRDFRKCNKQLLMHLMGVSCWCVCTIIFWLNLHTQGIQTSHLIQRKHLIKLKEFCCQQLQWANTLIYPNSNIYFVWRKTSFHPYWHQITFSCSAPFYWFSQHLVSVFPLFCKEFVQALTSAGLFWLSWDYKCFSTLSTFHVERKWSFLFPCTGISPWSLDLI